MEENKTTPDIIIEDETEQEDLTGTFDEEPETKEENEKKKKTTATTKTLVIAICAAVVLIAVLLTLVFMPKEDEEVPEIGSSASITTKLDKNNVWQVELKTKDGKLEENGAGELLKLIPADIKTVKLENDKGTTVISSYTPKTKTKETDPETGKPVEKTEQTQYTIKGYEDFALQSGEPDEIASACSTLSFSSVSCVDAGDKLSDFGFDNPRSIAYVTYNDGTKSVIKVGDNAPQNLGTYVMFGDSNAVFLCQTDIVEHLLYGITDLISLTINEAASDTENAQFKTITLNGEAYKDTVVIEPNQSNEILCDCVIISPVQIFADNTEASSVSGGLRGLYADEVVAVNPNADRLNKLGLGTPYAEATAVYPDTTVSFIASKPDSDGKCNLMKKDGTVVYKINADKIAWVKSSYEKLMSDYVLEVDLKTVSSLTVDGYSFDVTTKTINTTDDNGEESSTTETKTTYNGKEIDEGNFETFFSNISLLQKLDKKAGNLGAKADLTITYSYSSGRDSDTLMFFKNGSNHIVTINGTTIGTVDSSYVKELKAQAKAVSKDDSVESFW